MSWEAWLTLGVVGVSVALLARDLASPAVTFMAAVVILMVAEVVTPASAFQAAVIRTRIVAERGGAPGA